MFADIAGLGGFFGAGEIDELKFAGDDVILRVLEHKTSIVFKVGLADGDGEDRV